MSGDPAPVDLFHARHHKFKRKPGGKRGCAECGGAKLHMSHVGAPPSLNVHGSGANVFTYQTMKQNWMERLTQLLRESGLPKGLASVRARGQVCFPDRQRRDQGNFRFLIEKALGDALVKGGWLEDDDWSRYQFGDLDYAYDKGQSWTALTIFPQGVEAPDGIAEV